MDNNSLLYIGAGLSTAGMLLSPIIGTIAAVNKKSKDFRYGAFFLSANLPIVLLCGMGTICYFYEFLGEDGLAHAVAFPVAAIIIGILIAYKALGFRSKALFIISSIPYLLMVYCIPLFIFNLIYILKIYTPEQTPTDTDDVNL